MWTSKRANHELNSAPLTDSQFVKGEILELVDAVKTRNWQEVKEEMADVLFFSMCYAQAVYGINLPLIGAMPTVRKIQKRLTVWQHIFESNDLQFDKKYLVGGSNYQKQQKIDAALTLARYEQA